MNGPPRERKAEAQSATFEIVNEGSELGRESAIRRGNLLARNPFVHRCRSGQATGVKTFPAPPR
ncbi:hypothetical protein MZTS_00905 [Methylorubrum zatmanii]|nr:hypothetical protein [Methylorubrum zatmanii]